MKSETPFGLAVVIPANAGIQVRSLGAEFTMKFHTSVAAGSKNGRFELGKNYAILA